MLIFKYSTWKYLPRNKVCDNKNKRNKNVVEWYVEVNRLARLWLERNHLVRYLSWERSLSGSSGGSIGDRRRECTTVCIRFCESCQSSRRSSTAFFFFLKKQPAKRRGRSRERRAWFERKFSLRRCNDHHVSPVGKHSEEAHWQVVSAATTFEGQRDVKTVHCKHRKRWRRGSSPPGSSDLSWSLFFSFSCSIRTLRRSSWTFHANGYREIRDNSHLCNLFAFFTYSKSQASIRFLALLNLND